ncbi:hypothetical protein D0T12_29250 [Actinomadura spongiicola]|uniref:Uncharacterized protein n=2 Tax=Actinomadura spongiicola TaxID=2303421 RepID=A0A372G9J7_9ACTN|nr:hypothetical protein D0T12_29250 [Actinomadura spongiicola]
MTLFAAPAMADQGTRVTGGTTQDGTRVTSDFELSANGTRVTTDGGEGGTTLDTDGNPWHG